MNAKYIEQISLESPSKENKNNFSQVKAKIEAKSSQNTFVKNKISNNLSDKSNNTAILKNSKNDLNQIERSLKNWKVLFYYFKSRGALSEYKILLSKVPPSLITQELRELKYEIY